MMFVVGFVAFVAALCFWGLWRRANSDAVSVTVPKPRRRRQWEKPVPLAVVPGIGASPFKEIEPPLDLDASYTYQRMDTPFYFGDGYVSGQGTVEGESAIEPSLERTIAQCSAFSTMDTVLIGNAEDFDGLSNNHLDHSPVPWTREDVFNSTFMDGVEESFLDDYLQEESSVDLAEFMVGCSTTPNWETSSESDHGSGVIWVTESAHTESDSGSWETESELSDLDSGNSWETESEYTDSEEELILD
jgi:hypothetical protein